MIKIKKTLVLAGLVPLLGACASSTIKGAFLSSDKNIWVHDPGDMTVYYCQSNSLDSKADPVCYPARKASSDDIHADSKTVATPAPHSETSGTKDFDKEKREGTKESAKDSVKEKDSVSVKDLK